MRKGFLILAFYFFVASAAAGEPILPTDSGKDIEVRIAGILKDRLKIDAHLKVTGTDGDDLRVVSIFEADEQRNVPKLAVFADTRIMRILEGKVVSQVVSFFTTADVSLKVKDRLKLLEWANSWNNNILPIRIQIAKEKIVATRNVVVTEAVPLTEEQVVQAYLGVIRIWPAIMESLRKEGLT